MLDIAYLVETKIERKYFLLTLLLKKYLLRPLIWESFLLLLGFWSVIPVMQYCISFYMTIHCCRSY